MNAKAEFDGNHRLRKALKSGVEKITAYALSLDEHCNYMVDYNEKVYRETVGHWEK